MKSKTFSTLLLVKLTILALLFSSCDKDDSVQPTQTDNQFVSLEQPYLICANRNPGGVGFDFEYMEAKGGANNLDSLTVSDFEYDIKIRTIKAEKPDGSLSGAPFIQLYETVQAVNYSTIDTTCKGYTQFLNLNSSNIHSYTLLSDNTDFNINSVTAGNTGSPLLQSLIQEFNKLVIGQNWKEAANNDITDDEPVWIIQTREGKIIKLIITQFPSNPAPTSTGYISLEWAFVE